VAGTGRAGVAPALLVELGRRYLAAAERLAPGRRIIDTMPNNFKLVGAIRLALPHARVIHCHRDSAEHAAALHRKYYAQSGNEYAADEADAEAYVGLTHALMSFWQQRFPGFVLAIDMGDVATDGERQVRRLADFLSLSWLPELASLYQSEPRLG
jgi:hypothetical protein